MQSFLFSILLIIPTYVPHSCTFFFYSILFSYSLYSSLILSSLFFSSLLFSCIHQHRISTFLLTYVTFCHILHTLLFYFSYHTYLYTIYLYSPLFFSIPTHLLTPSFSSSLTHSLSLTLLFLLSYLPIYRILTPFSSF